jgi:hypothetical protein
MENKLTILGKLLLITSILLSVTIACNGLSVNEFIKKQKRTSHKEGFENEVLAYTGDIFSRKEWKRSYSVSSNQMNIVWRNKQKGAIAELKYQILEDRIINNGEFYSKEDIESLVFPDYKQLERTAKCTDDNNSLVLYEYTGELHYTNYMIKFWVKTENRKTLLDLSLIIPEEHKNFLDEYSQELFPTLSDCPK